MGLIWERKEKKFTYYLLKGPFVFFLILVNTLMTSWLFHVSFAFFTDAQDHMSLYEWVEHLCTFLK